MEVPPVIDQFVKRNLVLKLNTLLITLGFILFNLISGCKAESITARVDCSANSTSGLTVPNLVLVGTDVIDIASFNKIQGQLSKSYSAEVGGASLVLSLDVTPEYLTITRTFNEPSQVVHTKTYNVCKSGAILGSDKAHIRFVNNGILLLETESGVDGIPNDFWILYD